MEAEGNHGEREGSKSREEGKGPISPYLPSTPIVALPGDEATMMASMGNHGAEGSDTTSVVAGIDTESVVNGMVADPRKQGIPLFPANADGRAARVWVKTVRTIRPPATEPDDDLFVV